MPFQQLAFLIRQWAHEKGIFKEGTPVTQFSKTQEEVDELLEGIQHEDRELIKDAIGDVMVTLIIQAEMWDLSPLECLEHAYNVISKRKGKMLRGVFVKES